MILVGIKPHKMMFSGVSELRYCFLCVVIDYSILTDGLNY